MVLVSSLWRDSRVPPPVGKHIVVPRPSDHVLPAVPFTLPQPTAVPDATCLPRVMPPSREGRKCRVEDEARVINRRERIRFHGGVLRLSPREKKPVAADQTCATFATLALRACKPIFPSQPEVSADPHLGPIHTTTLTPRKPAPPLSATPRSLEDPVLRRLISTPRDRSPRSMVSGRSPRSSRPSTRENATNFSDQGSLANSERGRERSRSPTQSYFHDLPHTGFETLSARRPRGRQDDRDRDFDDAMLNPAKCVADINEFELANARRARAFLL